MTDIPLPAKKYYPFLDGFRAVAIIWVLFYHVNKFFELDRIWGALAGTPLLKIINSGFLGVDIFFVISGFLITGLLIRDLNGKVRVKRFYSRRFFKIIPHYFAAVFVGLIITGIFSPKFLFDLRTILGYFFFYNNYLPRIPILSHMWSIAIEEHFYFVLPLWISFICLINKDQHARKKLLFFSFVILIAGANMMRYQFCRLPGFMAYPGGWQMTHFRFDGLVFGCCLKLGEPFLAAQDPQKDKYLAPLAFICSLFIFLYISLNFNYQNWYHYTLAYVATGLLFAAALRGLYLLKIVAENRFLIWIGKNSYGMYLWHLIILFPFRRVYFYTDGSRPLIIGLYIITVILIGALSTGTIERYFLSVRKRLAP